MDSSLSHQVTEVAGLVEFALFSSARTTGCLWMPQQGLASPGEGFCERWDSSRILCRFQPAPPTYHAVAAGGPQYLGHLHGRSGAPRYAVPVGC